MVEEDKVKQLSMVTEMMIILLPKEEINWTLQLTP